MLILMLEAALVYDSGKGADIGFVSRKHTIPLEAFDDIFDRVGDTKLLAFVDGKICLQMPPDKIAIWQILTDVAGDNIFMGRYFDEKNPVTPTSAMIMLQQEQQVILKMIENRLRRQKLSVWSQQVSKMVYI